MKKETEMSFFDTCELLSKRFSQESKKALSNYRNDATVFLFSGGDEAENCVWIEGDAINLIYLLNRYICSLLKHGVFDKEELRKYVEKTIKCYEIEENESS